MIPPETPPEPPPPHENEVKWWIAGTALWVVAVSIFARWMGVA